CRYCSADARPTEGWPRGAVHGDGSRDRADSVAGHGDHEPPERRPGTEQLIARPAAHRNGLMSYTRQATRYRETEVLTATPGQLVVLLYDHLLLSLRRARTAMDARDVEAQSASLEKGRDVLTELLVTLDRDRG